MIGQSWIMSKECSNLAPSIGFEQKHFQFKRWRRVIDVGPKEFFAQELHWLNKYIELQES